MEKRPSITQVGKSARILAPDQTDHNLNESQLLFIRMKNEQNR